jgi:hypothetical protein
VQEFITTRQRHRLATSTGGVLTGHGADIILIQLVRFGEGLKPYLSTYRGRNPFEALATERVYTLVGRRKDLRGDCLRPSVARDPRPSAAAATTY